MVREKALDDKMFNCSQEHELILVYYHYETNKLAVCTLVNLSIFI